MFAEAFRVRASVTAVWLRNWSPPKRAGGAGGAPVEPGRPVPVEQRRERRRDRLRQRAQSLDDSPPGVGAGAGPSRSSAFYASGATLLMLRTATPSPSPQTSRVPLERSTNAHRAGKGRKEEGHKCHLINLSHLTRLKMNFLVGSVCCRPNTDFVVFERQIQL